MTALKRVSDAQESLTVQFAEHERKDKNTHAVVEEPAN
jgi:hypothetical protein